MNLVNFVDQLRAASETFEENNGINYSREFTSQEVEAFESVASFFLDEANEEAILDELSGEAPEHIKNIFDIAITEITQNVDSFNHWPYVYSAFGVTDIGPGDELCPRVEGSCSTTYRCRIQYLRFQEGWVRWGVCRPHFQDCLCVAEPIPLWVIILVLGIFAFFFSSISTIALRKALLRLRERAVNPT